MTVSKRIERKPLWQKIREKIFNTKFLFISILVHLLFGIGATYYVVQIINSKPKPSFKGGPAPSNPSQRVTEHKVQMEKKKSTLNTPVQARRILTTSLSKVSLPDAPMAPSLSSPNAAMGGEGGSFGSGAPSGSGGMGTGGMGAMVPFFGFKVSAKRIAFLVDYSGSMDGPFRLSMEADLEKSLKGLPPGTQILVIPWAGGAWLYNEVVENYKNPADPIVKKWKKIDDYDNFEVKPGQHLTTPQWVTINAASVEDIMKGIRAQKAWPGGTDWRSPFRYAVKVSPPPETIIFMTDGQIKNEARALNAIEDALKKLPKMPKLIVLWIVNKTIKPDSLKKLAAQFNGEFHEVKANPHPPK